MSGQETNQNQIEDINKKNRNLENTAHPHPDTSNDTLRDRPLLDLQTRKPLTPTHIRRVHLQRHPVWRQPGLGSANPDPYTHHTTPPTTPCVTAPPATNPQNLRTLTPQLEVRTPIAKAIWGNINLWKTSTSKFGPASADVAFRSRSLVDRYPQGNGRGIQRSKGWFVCNSMDQAPDISKVTTLVCHAYDVYMIFSMKVWCN